MYNITRKEGEQSNRSKKNILYKLDCLLTPLLQFQHQSHTIGFFSPAAIPVL